MSSPARPAAWHCHHFRRVASRNGLMAKYYLHHHLVYHTWSCPTRHTRKFQLTPQSSPSFGRRASRLAMTYDAGMLRNRWRDIIFTACPSDGARRLTPPSRLSPPIISIGWHIRWPTSGVSEGIAISSWLLGVNIKRLNISAALIYRRFHGAASSRRPRQR